MTLVKVGDLRIGAACVDKNCGCRYRVESKGKNSAGAFSVFLSATVQCGHPACKSFFEERAKFPLLGKFSMHGKNEVLVDDFVQLLEESFAAR